MYDFKDLDSPTADAQESSFGLKFNGKIIEQEIPGFLTLVVSGRGMVSRGIKASPSPGSDGAYFDYSNLPGREISVRYRIAADSAQELRQKYEKLNALLHTPNPAQLSFMDESTRYYIGSLSAVSEEEETANDLTGELSFYCPRPFKYSTPITKTGATVKQVSDGTVYRLLADFAFQPAADGASIQILNQYGEAITIGPVVAGKLYSLTLSGDTVELKENGLKNMGLLSINAGIETFRILPGINFSLSTKETLTATFQELRL